ncbi:uncharacterized protein SPSK_06558 [Sporothrix schenckii 1099-18]|uniref:Uncharacterized protein n=1 Tax=Sporothrix schenckii 1099-18 TaxID=1397361 RepID=A0A0F2MLD3_SPOSC|nr:uncharacterized protein SPSK_06558 [Sporothrix schenckii 1099-18]KJR89650.1 hypothetical protein SPSK_06558 [Sporothrix schenckii 1099-18]
MSDDYSSTFSYSGGFDPTHDVAFYRRRHRELYPGRGWSSPVKDLYDNYSSMTPDVNAKRARYDTMASEYGGISRPGRRTELIDVSNVNRDGHAALIGPASDCATTYLDYARGRHRFLDKEPYAYQTLGGRFEHERYARDNYDLAGAFRDRVRLHEHEAVDHAPTSSRLRSPSRGRTSLVSTLDDLPATGYAGPSRTSRSRGRSSVRLDDVDLRLRELSRGRTLSTFDGDRRRSLSRPDLYRRSSRHFD